MGLVRPPGKRHAPSQAVTDEGAVELEPFVLEDLIDGMRTTVRGRVADGGLKTVRGLPNVASTLRCLREQRPDGHHVLERTAESVNGHRGVNGSW